MKNKYNKILQETSQNQAWQKKILTFLRIFMSGFTQNKCSNNHKEYSFITLLSYSMWRIFDPPSKKTDLGQNCVCYTLECGCSSTHPHNLLLFIITHIIFVCSSFFLLFDIFFSTKLC